MISESIHVVLVDPQFDLDGDHMKGFASEHDAKVYQQRFNVPTRVAEVELEAGLTVSKDGT